MRPAPFRGDPGRLRAWFLTIAANQCRSQLRRPFFGWLPLPDLAGKDDHANDVAARHDLGQALTVLRGDQRLVLALFYYMDLPLAEVAQVLGVSEAAARSRLYRAVGQLRERLREVEGDK